jgi:hypothetical protein
VPRWGTILREVLPLKFSAERRRLCIFISQRHSLWDVSYHPENQYGPKKLVMTWTQIQGHRHGGKCREKRKKLLFSDPDSRKRKKTSYVLIWGIGQRLEEPRH